MRQRSFQAAVIASLTLAFAGCGAPAEMPDVAGKRLDEAIADLEKAGISDDPDLIGGGTFGVLDESNWVVCKQEPAAGKAVDGTPRLTVDRSCPDLVDPFPLAPMIGMTVEKADSYLNEMSNSVATDWASPSLKKLVIRDYSVLGRQPGASLSSTCCAEVMATHDKTFDPAKQDEEQVWTLTAEEAKWFAEHPAMPTVGQGDCLADRQEMFGGVEELIVHVWQPGRHPAGSSDVWTLQTSQKTWPEPWMATMREELISKRYLLNSYDEGTVSGQWPAPGATLQPGQPMLIFCQPLPPPAAAPGDGSEGDLDDPNLPNPDRDRDRGSSGGSGHPCLPGERDGDGDGMCGER